MAMNTKILAIFFITIFIEFGCLVLPVGAEFELDPRRVDWSQLSFHAKNFWVDVSSDIQMKALPASELNRILIPAPKGTPVKPQTSQVIDMVVNTAIKPRFRSSVYILNRIWFDPTNGGVLGRDRLRRGEDDFKKTYRFTRQGVFRHRIEPENKNQAKLAPEEWTDIKDTFYTYDPDQLGCSVVSERTVLIYILSVVARSESNIPMQVCAFGKRQLHRVEFRKAGTRAIKVNYIEKSTQNEIRKQGTVQAARVVIAARPIEPQSEDPENFSFLGFHKDISIYIELASGLPILVSGIIPTVGRADLKLQKARIKG